MAGVKLDSEKISTEVSSLYLPTISLSLLHQVQHWK